MDMEKQNLQKHTDAHITMSMLKSTDYTEAVSGAARWFRMQSDIIGHRCDEAERHLATD